MTESTSGFEHDVNEFVRATGRWRDTAPDALMRRWRRFVEQCVEGYPGAAEDYMNDLTVRDTLAAVMGAPSLSRYPEMEGFGQTVAELDARLRPVMRTDVFPRMSPEEWWNRGLVRFAGKRLVTEMREHYGVDIAERVSGLGDEAD